MTTKQVARWVGIAFVCFALVACGGGGDEASSTPAPPQPAPVGSAGAAGGTDFGPAGAQMLVTASALAQNTVIAVAQSGAGASPLPAGVTILRAMFAFTPHGSAFAAPVTITVPFDPALVPVSAFRQLLKTTVEQIAEIGRMFFDQPVVGPTQTLPPDSQTNRFVFSSANSVPYPVSAEAPYHAARYAANGALDTGFGVGGTLSIDFFQLIDIGESVLVQPDGKIAVSGSVQRLASDGYGLARINP
ncbi:MAG: hypothetical protein H7Z19_11730 [Chitinophagaceae bacterium]|nr:hypothetical protein [Rubrivivax sp.]